MTEPRRRTNRPATVAALLLALFIAAMEATVVSTAMPTVTAELGGARHYAWVFTAYMLTSTVMTPILGKLADLQGRKPVMLVSIAVFSSASIACGRATTMTELVIFRALQGVGAGGMQPLALTIVGDLFTLEERAKMQGFLSAIWAIAALVGPLVGGVLCASFSWRWVFYLNVPFGVAAGAVLMVALVEDIERVDHRLDLAGAGLLAVAAGALLLGVDGQAPAFLLPASLVLTVAFLAVERRAAEPMVPPTLFRNPVLATASGLSALSGAALMGVTTLLPLYAQDVLGTTPTVAGGVVAPVSMGWPAASVASAWLLRVVPARTLIRAGTCVTALASATLALLVHRHASPAAIAVASAGFGAGMGMASTPRLITVQGAVGFSQRGTATASTMFFRSIGGTVGLGIMGLVVARALVADAGGRSVAAELLATALTPGIAHALWLVFVFALASACFAGAALDGSLSARSRRRCRRGSPHPLGRD